MDARDPEIKTYCDRMESVWRHAASQYDVIEAPKPLLIFDPDALPGDLPRDQHAVRQSPLLGEHGC